MQSPDSIASVAEFHATFHHPILAHPQIPTSERAALRVALLREELSEFEEAIQTNNLVEAADALCDLQYVLMGAVLEFGLAESFKELFDEVQRSNMSKACDSEQEAIETVAHYEAKGTPCYYQKDGEKYLVFRTADNKTLKNVYYSPADLKKIIEKYKR